MSYQTGTATGVNDLLDKLRIFATGNGWTQDKWVATVGSAELYIHRGSEYVSLTEDGSQITVYANTGFNTSNAVSAQPGVGGNSASNDMAGSFTAYHFFSESTTSDYIHCVVERVPGEFRHICFGLLNKTSTYTGGGYVACDNRSQTATIISGSTAAGHSRLFTAHGTTGVGATLVRADVESMTDRWFTMPGTTPDRGRGGIGPNNALHHLMYTMAPNDFNAVTPLVPAEIYLEDSGGLYWPAGFVKDFRFVNLTNFSPSEQISIGSDNWLVFPEYVRSLNKTDPVTTNKNSWLFGYAYKKIT